MEDMELMQGLVDKAFDVAGDGCNCVFLFQRKGEELNMLYNAQGHVQDTVIMAGDFILRALDKLDDDEVKEMCDLMIEVFNSVKAAGVSAVHAAAEIIDRMKTAGEEK